MGSNGSYLPSAPLADWALSPQVISGCSAGGLATFLHVDNWAALPKLSAAKIRGMPDSGAYAGRGPGCNGAHGRPARRCLSSCHVGQP
jgi:hypothetical protein